MQKMLGVKIMLTGGHWQVVVLPVAEAVALVEDWRTGRLKLQGNNKIGQATPGAGAWAVQLDQVVGMHTFAPEEQVVGTVTPAGVGWQQQPQALPGSRSGLQLGFG